MFFGGKAIFEKPQYSRCHRCTLTFHHDFARTLTHFVLFNSLYAVLSFVEMVFALHFHLVTCCDLKLNAPQIVRLLGLRRHIRIATLNKRLNHRTLSLNVKRPTTTTKKTMYAHSHLYTPREREIHSIRK